MVEIKHHDKKEVLAATTSPPSEVRTADSTDSRSQVSGMTGTTTNNKFTTSMNRRKSRFGDRGQRGGRGRFNQGGPGRGSGGYDNKTKSKNNEEGKDVFTGNCDDLKNCLFVLDGKQIVNYDDCKDALVIYAQKNCSVAVAKTIEKGKDLSMVYYKQPIPPTSSSSSYQKLLTTE